MNTPTRFIIRWDDTTGQYKVSKSNVDYMEVVSSQDYDEATALISSLADQLNQLRLEHEEALASLKLFVDTCDTGAPINLVQLIGKCCANARAVLDKQTPPAAS